MSDIMDELLEEVEQLEQSTQALESANQNNANQKQQLEQAADQMATQASLLAFETSKTAQEAAIQSHQAAQSAIKQAESLKEQVLELNESNFNWRQAVRNANKEIQSAKNNFMIMLITAIVFSLIAVGAMGYLFYAMQKQEAQFKGEVLDMISTENTLLNKKITLKMDELASVIEILSQKVSLVEINNQKTPAAIQPEGDAKVDAEIDQVTHQTAAEPQQTESMMPQNDAETETPPQSELKTEHATTDNTLKNTTSESEETAEKNEHHSDNQHHQDKNIEQNDTNDAVNSPVLTSPNSNANIDTNSISAKEFTEIKQLIEQVLTEQNAWRSQMQQSSATMNLTPEHIKKLDGISWLVRQQAKTLKTIEKRVGLTSNNTEIQSSNNSILNELKHLQLQQGALQKQILDIQNTLNKYTAQPKEAAPYSYKAK